MSKPVPPPPAMYAMPLAEGLRPIDTTRSRSDLVGQPLSEPALATDPVLGEMPTKVDPTSACEHAHSVVQPEAPDGIAVACPTCRQTWATVAAWDHGEPGHPAAGV